MTKVKCENCFWEGTSDQLMLVWIANPTNPRDEYLTEKKVCPYCKQEDTIVELKPEQNEENN